MGSDSSFIHSLEYFLVQKQVKIEIAPRRYDYLYIIFFHVFLFCCPFCLEAESVTSEWHAVQSDNSIQNLLELSSTKKELSQMAELVLLNMRKYSAVMTRDTTDKMENIIRESYSIEKLYPVFEEVFVAEMHGKDTVEFEKWFKSSLGGKITEIEIEAMQAESSEAMSGFIWEAASLSEERKNLVREFLTVTLSEEYSRRLVCDPVRKMMLAAQAGLPVELRMDERILEERINSMERGAMIQYRAVLPVSTAFTYRKLSDAEFREMLDFYRKEEGQNFIHAVWRGTIAAMNTAAKETGEGIADILKASAKKRGMDGDHSQFGE